MLFRSLVFQELLAINEYERFGYDLYFWRTTDQHEVDFILYGEKGLIAIEVKSSKNIKPSDLHGLKLFKAEYPIAKLFIFYGGKEPIYRDDITILPLESTLKELSSFLRSHSI